MGGARIAVGLVLAALLAFVTVLATGQAAADDAVPSGTHVLVVHESPEQAAALSASQARLVERYETFAVVEASGDDAEALVEAGADLRDDMRELTVGGRTFDPATERAPLLAKASEPGAAGLALVQFVGPIKDAWLARLQKTGVRIVTYMAQNGYLVHGSAAQLGAVGELVGADPAVRAVVPYTADDKVAAGVGSGSERLAVQTLSGGDGSDTRSKLDALGRETGDLAAVGPFRTQFLRIDAGDAAELATDPGVIAVLPDPKPELLDERQSQILADSITPPGPSGPGYLAFHDALAIGSGTFPFTVDITDSGMDTGTPASPHPDLGGPSRIDYALNHTPDPDGRDCGGHGTHNAGIVAGLNTGAGATFEDAQGFNYGLGIAPRAVVGGSKIFTCANTFGLVGTLTALATAAYNEGARISNNSWGSNVNGAYDVRSQEFDRIVRDAVPGTPGNQELVEFMSAGNAGAAPNTLGAPGTAKNVITVGASEGVRASGLDGCGVPDAGADNYRDIINFSSRGPTDDGRIKPDLVGPGTHITSTRSQAGGYTGVSVCTAVFPAGSTLYNLSSGTSHSSPALAGIGALLREWYRINIGGGTAVPSPAMTKAILAQTSTDLVGGSNGAAGTNANVPTQIQGWGLGNIAAALDGTTPRVYRDQRDADTLGASGDSVVRTFAVQDSTKPVRISLAWTDQFGPTTGNAFVNDLNLSVSGGPGTFKGNVFSGGLSTTGGTADPANNLEQVYLPAGTTGNFAAVVGAGNIAGDGVPGNADATDQDFALVISNAVEVNVPVLTTGSRTVNLVPPGDGDGDLEPGERFDISQELRNIGTADATGITGSLTSPGPMTFPDATAAWPNLALGSPAAANADPLAAQLTPAASCGGSVELSLAITTAEGSSATVPVSLPTGATGPPVPVDSTDVPKAIPDNNAAGAGSVINIPGGGRIKDINVRIPSLTHTFVGDLKIDLTSPAGTTVNLVDRPGGGGNNDNNLVNVVFDDEAAAAIGPVNPASDATPAYTGTFRPQADQLSRFDGESQTGTWTLKVADLVAVDTGSLNSWGSDISPAVCDFVPAPRSLEISDVTVAEGDTGQTNATLTVTATPATGDLLSFDYTTANGTATAPDDYVQTSGSGTIPGESATTTIDVPIQGDTLDESDETLEVNLSNPSSGPITDATGSVVITDDDVPAGGDGGTVDRTAPETVINSGPKKKTKKKSATFAFSANEPATFKCKLDKRAFAACTSPAKFRVKKGRHRLLVQANDTAGNADQTPAARSWKVKKKKRRR